MRRQVTDLKFPIMGSNPITSTKIIYMKIKFNIQREVPMVHRTIVPEGAEYEVTRIQTSDEDPNFLHIYFKDGIFTMPIHKDTFTITL